MTKIFKYQLEFKTMQIIKAPIVKVLAIQEQDDNLVMWAEVFPIGQDKQVQVTLVGTGSAVPKDAGEYLTTLQTDQFVWHLYIKEVN